MLGAGGPYDKLLLDDLLAEFVATAKKDMAVAKAQARIGFNAVLLSCGVCGERERLSLRSDRV